MKSVFGQCRMSYKSCNVTDKKESPSFYLHRGQALVDPKVVQEERNFKKKIPFLLFEPVTEKIPIILKRNNIIYKDNYNRSFSVINIKRVGIINYKLLKHLF